MTLAMLLSASVALGAQSWNDPTFVEILDSCDAGILARVVVGGSFSALVKVERWLKGEGPEFVRVEGFNSYEWNNSYYAMRAGERYVFFLFRFGERYSLPTPSSGKYPVEGTNVIGCVAERPLRHPIDLTSFVNAVRALAGARSRADGAGEALSLFTRMLGRGSLEERHLAIEMTGNLRDPRGVELASGLASDPNPAMRVSAASALRRIGTEDAVKALLPFLRDGDAIVRQAAARALAGVKRRSGARALAEWLADSSKELSRLPQASEPYKRLLSAQREAAAALEEMADPDSVGALMRAAAVAELLVARRVVRALGLTGEIQALEVIGPLLEAEDFGLRSEALVAAIRLTGDPEATTPAKVRAHLASRRAGESESLSDRIDSYLASGGAAELARAKVLAVTVSNPEELALFARAELAVGDELAAPDVRSPAVLPFALRGMLSEASFSRAAALDRACVGAAGFPRLTRFLRPFVLFFLDDPSDTVRSVALTNAARISGEEVLPRLIREIEEGDITSRRLGAAALRAVARRRFSLPALGAREDHKAGLARWKTWLEHGPRAGAPEPPRPLYGPRKGWILFTRGSGVAREEGLDSLALAGEEGRKSFARALRLGDPVLTGLALSGLAECGDARTAGELAKLVSSEDPFVRLEALFALAVIATDEPGAKSAAAAAVVKAAKEPALAPLAVLLAGRLGMKGPVLEAAKSNSARTRAAAAMAASMVGKGAFPAAKALSAASGIERRFACLALGRMGGRGCTELVRLLSSSSVDEYYAPLNGLLLAVAEDGPSPAEAGATARKGGARAGELIPLLASDRSHVRMAAAFVISRYPVPDAAPALAGLLRTGDTSERYYAARALSESPSREVVDALVEHVADADSFVAGYVAEALEKLGDARALEALRELVGSGDYLNARAYAALGKVGDLKDCELLVLQTHRPAGDPGSWSARYYAILGLGWMRSDLAARTVVGFWADESSRFREVAREALGRMGEFSVPYLAELLRSGTREVRIETAELLGELGSRTAAGALSAAVGADEPELAFAADRALSKITGEKPKLGFPNSAEERERARRAWEGLLAEGR